MGKVLAIFKVLPEEPGMEKEIKQKILQEKKIDVKDIKEEDIAFGLKALKIGVIIEDSEGSKTTEIEKILSSIKGVKQAEMQESTLL